MSEIYAVDTSISTTDILTQLKGAKLVIPSIAIGNVPQLSTDLLLHNLNTKLIARLDSTLLYPFASPADYVAESENASTPNSTSTGLELYFNEETKLAVIQQRSPILPGYAKNFLDQLTTLIKDSQFSSVVVLDSNDSVMRADINIDRPLELYSNNLTEHFKSLKVSASEDEGRVKASFTPFVNAFVEELKKIDELTVFALVIFVYEGDNFFDAHVLSEEAVGVLELEKPKTWLKPVSWSGVYGDRPLRVGIDEGVYA